MTAELSSAFARPLVAVGGSDHSLVALRLGLDLADAVEGRATALVVREDLPRGVGLYARGETLRRFQEGWRRSARRAAEEAERRVSQVCGELGREVELRVVDGRVLDRVVEAAPAASMVLVGQRLHGSGGEGIGRNVELLLRRIQRPLLLAPARHRRIEKVIVAFAGKDLGILALALGAKAAAALGLPLEVFTVAGAARREQIERVARELLAGDVASTSFQGKAGDPGSSIVEHCTTRDLLVMGAYGHSRLYRGVLGSVTEQVIHQVRGPLIITGRPAQKRPVE